MSVRLSLAEQIAQLQEAAPVDFDPEDTLAGVEPAEDLPETTTAREHYVDVGPSTLRKLQSIADPKYAAVKTSRKQLMEDSEGEPSDLEENYPQGEAAESGEEREDQDDDESIPSQSEPDSEEPHAPAPPPHKPPRDSDPEPVDDLTSTLRKTRDEDRKKGKAVSQQIALWETLLDARIRLQKSVVGANRLPSSSHLAQYTEIEECRQSLDKMLEEAFLLSDELFDVQEKLMSANESIVVPPRKRRRIQDDATPSDYSAQLHEATNAASALEHAYHPHLVQTLTKWSAKIQAVAPAALLPSNRNTFSSRNSQNLKSSVQLIDETLVDHRKLLARTQVRRGKGVRVGETAAMEDGEDKVDTDVFDDTDFYQQLLREIIDARGDGPGADDWMSVQRQKKAKKKVDTKASKGRKLRYEAHEKLQNFMVPVPVPGMWHEEQIDELFSSLMGRGFEGALGQADESMGVDEPPLGGDVLKGFRVFG
ncbi:apoptosis antagonizing transcription factor-domain-containing protein [Mycena sanguinolenta]|nr:apoptosis antagonizing transcription factor-domain-containing protein [Mycena sanguinolenta]